MLLVKRSLALHVLGLDHTFAHERREQDLEAANFQQPLAVARVGVRREIEDTQGARPCVVLLAHAANHELEALAVAEARLVGGHQHRGAKAREQVLHALLLVFVTRRALSVVAHRLQEHVNPIHPLQLAKPPRVLGVRLKQDAQHLRGVELIRVEFAHFEALEQELEDPGLFAECCAKWGSNLGEVFDDAQRRVHAVRILGGSLIEAREVLHEQLKALLLDDRINERGHLFLGLHCRLRIHEFEQ
mmetsp:Transcript_81608/g.231397  ORF Transcript_81608/g.231397 Transcript_81608/m.231397 type:complete len:245 (+) Transcript_81608:628-1362(+)